MQATPVRPSRRAPRRVIRPLRTIAIGAAVAVVSATVAAGAAAPAAAAAPGRITGTVAGIQVDADTGIAAAIIAAYRASEPRWPVATAFATGVGAFSFDLPPGDYRLSAVTESRALEWNDGSTSFDTAAPVAVGSGADTAVDFDLDIPALAFTGWNVAVTGFGDAGTPLTVEHGPWSPQPDSFGYQWLRGSVPIPGATGVSYTLGQPPTNIQVAVTPRKAGYSPWPSLGLYLATVPTPGLDDLLGAMDPEPGTHIGDRANPALLPSHVHEDAIAVATRPIRGFPTEGDSYAVLSTGLADEALATGPVSDLLSTELRIWRGNIFDTSDETSVRLSVDPPPGMECLALDFLFGSEEYPESRDYLPPIPGVWDWMAVESPTLNVDDSGDPKPTDFALAQDGGLFASSAGQTVSTEPGWRLDGWAQPMTAHVPLGGQSTAGAGYTDVFLTVREGAADSSTDSVLLVDNLRFEPAAGCPDDGIATPIGSEEPVVTGTAPKVQGAATIGTTLRAVPGAWAPASVELDYQWLRNGRAIPGADEATYRVRTIDLLSRLSVRVTGSATGADPVTLTSAQTARVTVR